MLHIFMVGYICHNLWQIWLLKTNASFLSASPQIKPAADLIGMKIPLLTTVVGYSQDVLKIRIQLLIISTVLLTSFIWGGGFSFIDDLAHRFPSPHSWMTSSLVASLWVLVSSCGPSTGFMYVSDYVLRKKHQLPTESHKDFLITHGFTALLAALVNVSVIIGTVWIIRLSPHWWLIMIGIAVIVVTTISVILPMIFIPFTQKTRPLRPHHPYHHLISELILKSSMKLNIVITTTPSPSRKMPMITGWGGSLRLVLSPRFLKGTKLHVRAAIATTLARYIHKHHLKMMVVKYLIYGGGISLVWLFSQKSMITGLGFTTITPYAQCLSVLLWAKLLFVLLEIPTNSISRLMIYQADAEAAQLTSSQEMIDWLKSTLPHNHLTSHPPLHHKLYSIVHYNTPMITERITALQELIPPESWQMQAVKVKATTHRSNR